jgi:hypothetical protein
MFLRLKAREAKSYYKDYFVIVPNKNSNSRPTQMHVSLNDLLQAFEFISCGDEEENQAFLCKQTGKIYWQSSHVDDLDDTLPEDISDSDAYLQIPDKKELGLGKPLALDFAQQFLPNDFDEIRQIFKKKGAYATFKRLLDRRRALNQWYDFEAKAEEEALRMWGELHSIKVID